ncbi:MAG: alpha/beta hydrolase, partial [Rhodospirillaceae bacterium]
LRLPLRKWLPEHEGAELEAVVIAVHGFNDYSKAFSKVPGTPGVGPYLAARGVAVFAYDQRGFGQAPHFGLWPGTDVLTRDFKDLSRVLRNLYPDEPLFALGESMGGAVVMTALASQDAPQLDGAVLVAPAVWARSTMPPLYRAALWAGARLVPALRPSGRSLGRMASDNMEMLRDNARDALFIKETRIDAVYGLTNLMDEALLAPPQIEVPVLYLYGRNDEIIPKEPTVKALTSFNSAGNDVRAAFYEDSWHMMLRDNGAEKVLKDIVSFVSDPSAQLPSNADQNTLERLQASLD